MEREPCHAVANGVIVSGVRQGTRRLAVTNASGKWSVAQAWHTADVTMYMSSPVLVQGALYGHSTRRRGQFVAVDPESGKLLRATEGRNAPSASVLAAGQHLVYLTTDSQLIVTAIDAAVFREVGRYNVAASTTYSHPVVLRDRVIVRDESHVTEWTIK